MNYSLDSLDWLTISQSLIRLSHSQSGLHAVTRTHKRSVALLVNPAGKLYFKKQNSHASDSVITHMPLINQSDLLIKIPQPIPSNGVMEKLGAHRVWQVDLIKSQSVWSGCGAAFNPQVQRSRRSFALMRLRRIFIHDKTSLESAKMQQSQLEIPLVHNSPSNYVTFLKRISNPSNNNVNFTSPRCYHYRILFIILFILWHAWAVS